MIETMKGLENARKIAGIEGVDLVFIGTGDLALSLGAFPEIEARHEDACREILDACRRHWTPCGIFTTSADAAAKRRARGTASPWSPTTSASSGGDWRQPRAPSRRATRMPSRRAKRPSRPRPSLAQ